MKSSFKKRYQLGFLMLVSTSLMACSALNHSSFTELVPSFSPSPSPSPLDAATLLILENKIYQQ
ncbi:MAG: CAP domain-containing protein, partial [Microcystis panniformis]